jgi:hypothetical protein
MQANAPTDDGVCEQCGELNNGSTFYPYCSEACDEEAFFALALSGDDTGHHVRAATEGDAPWVKAMADRHKGQLGFLTTAMLRSATLLVVPEAGFVRYHTRRDGWSTVYDLCSEGRERGVAGVGRALLEAVPLPRRLRCPEHIAANGFYKHLGGYRAARERGKQRRLNVWEWSA